MEGGTTKTEAVVVLKLWLFYVAFEVSSHLPFHIFYGNQSVSICKFIYYQQTRCSKATGCIATGRDGNTVFMYIHLAVSTVSKYRT